jgi:LmbE family N-acetylglucosaminyl deacetylase
MTTSISRLFHPAAASRTILGVWAHPDDEAYLSAAFMAAAVRAGHRVVVATATRGEGGTPDPELLPPEVLGPLRELELAASLDTLGVSEHHWLADDLRDGTLADVPLADGRRLVSDLLETVDPDLVVTFGPDGLTGHPDHRAVSRWVSEAWFARGRRGELWHAALTEQFLDQWGELCDDLGVWMAPDAPRAVPSSAVVHLQRCDDALAARKLAALRAHASQTTGLIAQVGEATFARWWSQEAFAPAR